MTRGLTQFLSGSLFALGLTVAGMTQPSKVIGFLDVFGNWDPSLALVMGAALAVHAFSYHVVLKRRAPVYALTFQVPSSREITTRLVLGSAAFGVGWGLVGYCPGPAVTSLGTGEPSTLLFVGAMVVAMAAHGLVSKRLRAAQGSKQETHELGVPRVVTRALG